MDHNLINRDDRYVFARSIIETGRFIGSPMLSADI